MSSVFLSFRNIFKTEASTPAVLVSETQGNINELVTRINSFNSRWYLFGMNKPTAEQKAVMYSLSCDLNSDGNHYVESLQNCMAVFRISSTIDEDVSIPDTSNLKRALQTYFERHRNDEGRKLDEASRYSNSIAWAAVGLVIGVAFMSFILIFSKWLQFLGTLQSTMLALLSGVLTAAAFGSIAWAQNSPNEGTHSKISDDMPIILVQDEQENRSRGLAQFDATDNASHNEFAGGDSRLNNQAEEV